MSFPVEAFLMVLLMVVATAMIRSRNLLAVTLMSGVFSFLSAGIYTLIDAVDVAFTECAVGAGISTVLLLGTLSLTSESEKKRGPPSILPILVCGAVGAALLWASVDMPSYGDASAAIHHHVAPHYINESPREVGLPNFVTSVLASYRGYDTLGELGVTFTAGIAVLLLIGNARREDMESGS